jgi:hypothetical protein
MSMLTSITAKLKNIFNSFREIHRIRYNEKARFYYGIGWVHYK